jgi:hypothetical protein
MIHVVSRILQCYIFNLLYQEIAVSWTMRNIGVIETDIQAEYIIDDSNISKIWRRSLKHVSNVSN